MNTMKSVEREALLAYRMMVAPNETVKEKESIDIMDVNAFKVGYAKAAFEGILKKLGVDPDSEVEV